MWIELLTAVVLLLSTLAAVVMIMHGFNNRLCTGDCLPSLDQRHNSSRSDSETLIFGDRKFQARILETVLGRDPSMVSALREDQIRFLPWILCEPDEQDRPQETAENNEEKGRGLTVESGLPEEKRWTDGHG